MFDRDEEGSNEDLELVGKETAVQAVHNFFGINSKWYGAKGVGIMVYSLVGLVEVWVASVVRFQTKQNTCGAQRQKLYREKHDKML